MLPRYDLASMEMTLYLVVGFILLWKGGDMLVEGADAFPRLYFDRNRMPGSIDCAETWRAAFARAVSPEASAAVPTLNQVVSPPSPAVASQLTTVKWGKKLRSITNSRQPG